MYKINGKLAELLKRDGHLGLFLFADGHKFVFNMNSRYTVKVLGKKLGENNER